VISPEPQPAEVDDPRDQRPAMYLLPPLPPLDPRSRRSAIKLHAMPIAAAALLALLLALVISSAL
jgi:hypothetical protein